MRIRRRLRQQELAAAEGGLGWKGVSMGAQCGGSRD